jgi:hypothetical protein
VVVVIAANDGILKRRTFTVPNPARARRLLVPVRRLWTQLARREFRRESRPLLLKVSLLLHLVRLHPFAFTVIAHVQRPMRSLGVISPHRSLRRVVPSPPLPASAFAFAFASRRLLPSPRPLAAPSRRPSTRVRLRAFAPSRRRSRPVVFARARPRHVEIRVSDDRRPRRSRRFARRVDARRRAAIRARVVDARSRQRASDAAL